MEVRFAESRGFVEMFWNSGYEQFTVEEFLRAVTAASIPGLAMVYTSPEPHLPTEQGTVIMWDNGAYLPQIAQFDYRQGWWARGEGDMDFRWMSSARLRQIIGTHKWVRLIPENESDV